jgi:putative FmdB family regulatory protein
MPLYEFECRDCDVTFEERRPFSRASDAAVCPRCHGHNTRKQLGTVTLMTNGGTDAIPVPVSKGGGCGCGGGCACHG